MGIEVKTKHVFNYVELFRLNPHIRRPLLARGHQAARRIGSKQHVLQPFQTFSMSSYNLSNSSKLVGFQLVVMAFMAGDGFPHYFFKADFFAAHRFGDSPDRPV